jgi:hypothetical protein
VWCQKEKSLQQQDIASWAASPKQVTCSHCNSNIFFVFLFCFVVLGTRSKLHGFYGFRMTGMTYELGKMWQKPTMPYYSVLYRYYSKVAIVEQ